MTAAARSTNRGGTTVPGVKVRGRSYKDAMEMFDALPQEHRLLLMDLPVNMTITNSAVSVQLISRALSPRFTESCLKTYGPDHPQAHIPITPLRRQKVY